MKSLIDTDKLHISLLNRQFKYAEMLDIDKLRSEQTPIHQIMTKEYGKGKKWQLLSSGGEELVYPTAEDAKADVAKLNKWKKGNSLLSKEG